MNPRSELLEKVETFQNMLIAYATREDNLAQDGKGADSPFTEALLKHIETPGQSLQDLAKATQGEVRDLAAKANHEQFPDYFDRTVDKPVLKEAAVSPAENAAGQGAG